MPNLWNYLLAPLRYLSSPPTKAERPQPSPESHQMALSTQSNSPLMTLPRELRDKIWWEVSTGHILHVSRNPKHTFNNLRAPKYLFHTCLSPKGFKSSACPTGQADHSMCTNSSTPSTYPALKQVCKAICQEFPGEEELFYSHNAFQFDDLITAEEFLFGLEEWQRASITHLRLALPWTLENDGQRVEYDSWRAICNYFSCPWDRKTLHMGPDNQYAMEAIKEQVYFYYSDCYYYQNKHRMGKRWQVGLGNTSWDIGISDVIYKGEPRMDLAMRFPTNKILLAAYLRTTGWLRYLRRFKQYDNLSIQFYTPEEVKSSQLTEQFVAAVKEEIAEPVIGPRKCIFFTGRGGD